MFVDLDGKAPGPGDLFQSPDAAAVDWGKHYNGLSIINKTEMISIIYKINIRGSIKYSYSIADTHGKHGGTYNYKYDKSNVAIIHSHGNYDGLITENDKLKQIIDNDFSKNDKQTSEKLGIPIYLVTPNGTLKMYNPQNEKSKIISVDMPSDPNDPSRLNQVEPINKTNSSKDFLKVLITKINAYVSSFFE